MANLNWTASDHLKLYNKAIVGLPESERYDLTRSKWTDFTNNWRMVYPHLDSKQHFKFSQPKMGPIYPLHVRMSSHHIHT